jgi:electron transport complex protein RnfB
MATLELLMTAATLATPLGLIAAAGLRYRAASTPDTISLVDRIDALLPQTQCGQCGHPGCRPYAEAIAQGEAFNRCPPGREQTVIALAQLLHEQPLPLDIGGPQKPKAVAFIREAECIGCTKCIQACPVDAILGAAKLMHTVIANECTGCDLCVEPCPVDCIDMLPLSDAQWLITTSQAAHYKTRFVAHNARLQRDHAEQEQRRAQRKTANATAVFAPFAAPVVPDDIPTPITEHPAPDMSAATADKQVQIQAAIARAKAKKEATAARAVAATTIATSTTAATDDAPDAGPQQ